MIAGAWVLSELSLPRVLWQAATGRRPVILAVDAYLPPLAGLLERLVRRLATAGRVQTMASLFPAMDAMVRNPNLSSLEDLFADLEAWQNRRFRFADAGDGPYAMAFRQVTCKYLQDRYIQLMFLKAARESQAEPIPVLGRPQDASDLDAALAGAPPQGARPASWRVWPVNLMLTLAMIAASWAGLARRIRRDFETTTWFLAADYIEDPRDCALYADAAEGGPVLLVKRTPGMDPARVPCGPALPACEAGDGLYRPGQALAAAWMVARDGLAILLRWGWTSPALFYALAALPNKRMRLRGWFNRYRPRHHWARDEYNVDHILRTQELHRIGGRSLSIMHGIQALADLNPRRRYICFDVFYVFGLHLIDRLYRATWQPDMKIQAVGSFGFSRARLASGPDSDARAITVFGGICLHQPELAETVRRLAEAFPDSPVVLKPKLRPNDPALAALAEAVGAGRGNVSISLDDAGEVIAASRYVVSDPSTVVAEAIHLGVPAVMLDVAPDHRTCLYRDFAGLCQPGPDAVVARIKAFEDGTAVFRRDDYASLVDLSGTHFLDFVRADLGLPPRRPNPSEV